MTTTAAFGWGSSHLNTTPAGKVNLGPAERLAIQQTLARYAFALDHGDLVALEGVLTEDATWTATIADEVEQGPLVGRAAILDLVRDATEAPKASGVSRSCSSVWTTPSEAQRLANQARPPHRPATMVQSRGPAIALRRGWCPAVSSCVRTIDL
jgi:hypothetical protein